MKQAYSFPDWLPDLPANDSGALVRVKNTFVSPNGYRAIPGLQPVTTALANFRGGAAFVSSDGTAALLGGTTGGMSRFSYPNWTSVYSASTNGRWQFAQFGDNVIGVWGGAPAKFDLAGGTGGLLGGSPPAASLVATVRDFVWLAGDPADIQTLTISAFNNSEGWTPGTDQSTTQPFPSGGEIMGLASGEYGLVLQKTSIKRGTYVGGDVIWQFDEISANVGCISKGSVAQAGRLVFFLSERGFMVCDGTDVKPIGAERVDRTFFASYSRADLVNLYTAVDPRQNIVTWYMPGNPGRMWCYNYSIDKWSEGEFAGQGLVSAFTANVSLEGIDTLFPGGIDTVTGSLDDPIYSGGNPLLLAVTNAGVFSSFSGPPLAAYIETSQFQLSPGRYASISAIRPISDAADGVSISVESRARYGDTARRVTQGELRPSGVVPIRANGRYQKFDITISSDNWTYIQGLEFEFQPGEDR